VFGFSLNGFSDYIDCVLNVITLRSFRGRLGLIRLIGLTALLPGLLFTGSCSDSETPTNPSGVAQVAGTWTGNFRIAACTDTLNGDPGTFCAPLLGAAAPRQPITLALQQTDDKVVGNIQFSGWYVRSLVVTGLVQAGGAVLLEGTTTWTEPACPTVVTPVPGKLTVTLWNTLVNRTSDGMSGDFRLTATTRTAPCAFGEVAIQADTLQLTKQ
jgi:hypothetical protein